MQCVSCNKSHDKETFPCDACKEIYCINCSNICQSEVRMLQLKNGRVLHFVCTKCRFPPIHDLVNIRLKSMETTLLEEIKNLHREIRYQDEKLNGQTVLINRLINEIADIKLQKATETYADVAKTKTNEVIVVKPREKQNSNKTKDDIKSKIDPRRMAIAVENIREGKEGAVIINCSNTNTKQKIKDTVESELGSNYRVIDGQQKDPMIIIRGVEEEFINGEDENIIEALKEQNEIDVANDTVFKVLSKYNQKEQINKGNIVLKVDTNIRNKLCQIRKVNIGWRRCVVHEYFRIVRCFRCARYGHIAAKCQNNTTCFTCAGPHKTSECSADFLKCINCVDTNNKLKKSLNVDHSVVDSNCPCYKRMISLEEKKTKQM